MLIIATSLRGARGILSSPTGIFFDRVIGVGPEVLPLPEGTLGYHVRGAVDRPLEVRRVLTVDGTVLIYCPEGTSRAPGYAVALHAREARHIASTSLSRSAEWAVEAALMSCEGTGGSLPHAGIVAQADAQLGYEGALIEAVARGW